MKSTFKILFYLKRGAIRANGCALIMGRITVDGVGTQFSTKLEVKPEEWDTKANRATGRSNANKQVNSLLEEIKASLHNIYHEMQRRDNYVTAEKVHNAFLGIGMKHETLLTVFSQHNEDYVKQAGKTKVSAAIGNTVLYTTICQNLSSNGIKSVI